jgi:uncharacterized protein
VLDAHVAFGDLFRQKAGKLRQQRNFLERFSRLPIRWMLEGGVGKVRELFEISFECHKQIPLLEINHRRFSQPRVVEVYNFCSQPKRFFHRILTLAIKICILTARSENIYLNDNEMLAQFTVENFLSFKEETVFSMLASSDERHPSHIIQDKTGKAISLLRTAAIYGPNASGKSNLIEAISFARDLILDGTKSGQAISYRPFKLSKEKLSSPSRFEFIIKHKGVIYSYGFVVNSKTIIEEWLFATPEKKELLYFERSKSTFSFGISLTGKTSKRKQFIEFVAQGTRPNQLFLTQAVDQNVEEVKSIVNWFKNVLTIVPAESTYNSLEMTVHKNKEFTKFLGDFLKSAGTGIEEVAPEEIDVDIDKLFRDAPDSVKSKFRDDIAGLEKDSALILRLPFGERFVIASKEKGKPVILSLKTMHLTDKNGSVPFDIEEESDGTQRLINLIPTLFELRKRDEMVFLIDELDRRLHPHLTRLFLQTVLECCEQEKKNQVIFTTHDTNLLDLDILRRDEIWFIEKDSQGASHPYSLAEFKVRPDLKIGKGYLHGRFGAIPFIGKFDAIQGIASE